MPKKFGGRKFKKEKGRKARSDDDEDDDDDDRDTRRSKGKYGKKGGKGRGRDDDAEFVHITGLFESSSGRSFTVFAKPEIIEKLQEIEEDDLIGVSEAKYGMSLWVKKAD